MQTRASLLFESPGDWVGTTVELDEPKFDEVLVQMAASGLCHSDDHYATGDLPNFTLPICGGHEGSGIVRQVGPGVQGIEVGDHVVTSFIPCCGSCRWCVTGNQHLCDNGWVLEKGTLLDGTTRMSLNGEQVYVHTTLGTFSEYQVFSTKSVIKVPKELPLDVICIVACSVPTGWGSATYAADLTVGDVVIVMGSGGIGVNAVQGAAHMGASHVVVADPHEHAREVALTVGATEAFADMGAAVDFVNSITNGQGADATIVTTGVRTADQMGSAVASIRKGGTVVLTALGPMNDDAFVPMSANEFILYGKRIQGAVYGNAAPRFQVPHLLRLYREGKLKLDELITTRYSIDEVGKGYADMRNGRNVRGIVDFEIL